MTPLLHIDRAEGIESPTDDNFSRWVLSALRAAPTLAMNQPELCLRIADRDEVTRLNERYRGKAGATNVLSFPVDLPDGVDCELLGDIVICAPLVESEAEAQDKCREAHWAHLTVHGVLHLLGYDHTTESGARVMEALEVTTLAGLGYPDPYEDQIINSLRRH